MKPTHSLAEVRAAKGSLQSFANRLLLEPLFDRATWIVANFTNLSPNQLSTIGFVFGIGAAVLFCFQHFILGAVFFEIMNLFDTFDGRISRLKGQGSKWGMYVDSYLGFWITFFMAFGLISGVYALTNDIRTWVFGLTLYFLLIIHFLEGNIAGFILGGHEKYHTIVTAEGTSAFVKLRNWLVRNGYREPFNMTDNQHIIFFIMPVTGLFFELYWVVFGGILINSFVWYLNYRTILNHKPDRNN